MVTAASSHGGGCRTPHARRGGEGGRPGPEVRRRRRRSAAAAPCPGPRSPLPGGGCRGIRLRMRGESPGRRGRRAQNHASPRRDEDRGTTQDSRRRRRPSQASSAYAAWSAGSLRERPRSRSSHRSPTSCICRCSPGGLRGADAPVRGGVTAPQPPPPDPDRAGRGDRRGHAGEGLRDPEDHGRDRERAVRLHRAGGGQRHQDLRHPGAAGQRPGDEDTGRGRLRPRPRHRPYWIWRTPVTTRPSGPPGSSSWWSAAVTRAPRRPPVSSA